METITKYFTEYHTEFNYNVNNFSFQEDIRKDWCRNFDKYSPTGHEVLKYITDNYLKIKITESFSKFIFRTIKMAQDYNNVKPFVKDILLYPLSNPLPLIKIKDLKYEPSVFQGKMKLICGKIPYISIYIEDFKKHLFGDMRIGVFDKITKGFCVNMSTNDTMLCQLDAFTLVGSSVIGNHRLNDLIHFIEKYDKTQIDLNFDGFYHTFSQTWPKHGICVMAKFSSQQLDKIVSEFNDKFEKINVQFASTFLYTDRNIKINFSSYPNNIY